MHELCRKLQQLRAHADNWAPSDSGDQPEHEALGRLAARLQYLIADIEAVVASIRSPQN